MRRIALLVTMTLVVLAVPAFALDVGETVQVNLAPDGSNTFAAGDHDLSADGRCVVFASNSANLPGANSVVQIYLRDTVDETTTLVSATPGGAGGNGQSGFPVVTPDCRYVAWDSDSTNLTATTVSVRAVYRRDMQMDETVLVSRASGASGAIPNTGAFTPNISADGSRVVFTSSASNLVAGDTSGFDVFIRDLDTNTTQLVTRNDADQPQSSPSAFYTSLSDDGSRVAFTSTAANLSTEDNDGGVQDTFVRDVDAGTTTLVSRNSGAAGAPGAYHSAFPRISGDGRRVAFTSLSANLGAGTAQGVQQLYLRDLETSQTLVLSRATGAAGAVGNSASGGQTGHDISPDGNRVVFQSSATNLGAAGGTYVRDLAAGTTTRITPTSVTASSSTQIAPDGEHVTFFTPTGLVAGDTDGQNDLYLRRLGPAGNLTPTPSPTATPGGGTPPPAPPVARPAVTLRGEAAFVRGTANDLYLACTTLDLYLVDVLPAGRRVAVTGAADLRLAGQSVEILLDGKRVGAAVIGADGAFAARVKAPSKKRRAKARYQARVGTTASQKLRLARRMVATTLTRSGANLVLRGVVNPPRARKQPVVAVDRFLSCRRREAVKVPKVKPDRRGRFSVRIKVPAGANAVLYRARTKVPARAGRPATKGTFTLPRAANVG